LDDTARRAEQLREACKHLEVQHRGQSLGIITISLGVAAYPQHGNTLEEILRAVDTALHQAKAEGRNRVAIAETHNQVDHA
jgi:diguanylate cyclase (GGDEF)-like protein